MIDVSVKKILFAVKGFSDEAILVQDNGNDKDQRFKRKKETEGYTNI